jgi:hypothetical protein
MSDEAIELLELGRGDARSLGARHAEVWGDRAAALFGVRWRLLRARSRIKRDSTLRALAEAHLPVLQAFHAPALEELEGFAQVSGLEPWQLVVLNHYTDFRDIPFHSLFEGMGGHGELVERREDLGPAIRRAIASGKTACVNVKAKGVISPIVLATTSKRDKASIE